MKKLIPPWLWKIESSLFKRDQCNPINTVVSNTREYILRAVGLKSSTIFYCTNYLLK